MTDDELDAIEARVEKATPGDWRHYLYPQTETYGVESRDGLIVCGNLGVPGSKYGKANAEFIAHAREDMPRLIARVRELENERSRLVRSRARVVIEQHRETLDGLEACDRGDLPTPPRPTITPEQFAQLAGSVLTEAPSCTGIGCCEHG